jgi:PAS domain S-box-containing protein
MDEAGVVRGWNRAAEQLFGYSRDQAIGRELAELIVPGPLRDAHRNALQRYRETREPTMIDRRVEVVGMRHDGSEISVELTITELPGTPLRFAGFIRPVAERQRASREAARLQKRMAFLAQAGLVLDQSLELEETLRRLAELTVPELAQLTVLDLVSEAGAVNTTVAAAIEPEHAQAVEQIRREQPLDLLGAHPVAQALRTRRAELLPTMSPSFQREIAQGGSHYALMRRLRYKSAIVVPLIARQRTLGVLSLLRLEGNPSFTPDELVLAEDLGRRAALAIDNSRLFEVTRRVAVTLQESLLPRALPEIRGVTLAARYRAAGQGQEVGGDFYDAFPLDGDCWGIVIGDVRGKGPRAAAVTALARYTIRALCDRGAAQVLALLNAAVQRDADRPSERFMTAVVGVVCRREAGLAIELAAAGHPPPLILRADGEVQAAPVAGPLIGVIEDVLYEAHELVLAPGDTLVLYTDGLTDAQAPARIISEDELGELLVRAHGLGAEGLASFLVQEATGEREPRDDIALLVLEVGR